MVLNRYLQNSLEQINNNISQTKKHFQEERNSITEKYTRFKAVQKQKQKILIEKETKQYNEISRELKKNSDKQLAETEHQKDLLQKACKREYEERSL